VTILYDHDEAVGRFVGRFIPGGQRGFGEFRGVGFLDNAGRLEAGIVYHNWNPECGVVEVSAASLHRKWVTRDRLRAIFGTPFERFGCRMIVARTSERNEVVRRIWRSIGGSEHVIPGLRADGEAEVILTLHARDWFSSRFARGHNGQAVSAEAA
jgi:RimJ/RimL family protein N-acetyltransferase